MRVWQFCHIGLSRLLSTPPTRSATIRDAIRDDFAARLPVPGDSGLSLTTPTLVAALVPSFRPAVRGAFLTFVPAFLAAQSANTGVVAGRVTTPSDTGTLGPAAGASVTLSGTRLGATTNANGRFQIDRVPAGAYTLHVRRLGFRAEERAIQVAAGDTLRIDVTLRPEAQVLSPMRTNAPSADAEVFVTRPNVATIRMGADAIKGVPSIGEPDVVRVTMLLPGVAARNDFNTGLIVRGGEADQNLVLLDGHPI